MTALAFRHVLARLLAVALVFAGLLIVFLLFVRPWYLQWGATAAENRRPLPGDGIIAHAVHQQTRAITIDAPIERVWPWLAQIGQDRGGFYSYDILENLVGCQMPTDDFLRPDRQPWRPGDRLWMYPPDRAGGMGFATLREHIPERALGFATRAVGVPLSAPETGSWSFILEPLEGSRTRLLIRGRMVGRSPGWLAFDRLVFEPIHFVMERRMMIGLKEVAEAGIRGRVANHFHPLLWTVTLVLFLAAGFMAIRGPAWGRPLALFLAAGVVFQVLTLVQPPLLMAMAFVLVLLAAACPNRIRAYTAPASPAGQAG